MVLALVGPPPADSPKELQLKPGDTIVAIGDSITAGGGYLRDIDAVLAQQYPDLKIPKVVNKGIGGQKAEDLVKRFDNDVVQLKPAVVTISIGINDVWHRLDKAARPEKSWRPTKRTSPRWSIRPKRPAFKRHSADAHGHPGRSQSRGQQAAGGLREGRKDRSPPRKKCQLVDLHGMFLDGPEAETGRPGKWLTSDGVHMKPARRRHHGHRRAAGPGRARQEDRRQRSGPNSCCLGLTCIY